MKAISKKVPRTVLILGVSGSGKDTQMNLLAGKYGYVTIGTGDMLREEYEKRSALGLEAHKYWGKGNLVPDVLVYELFAQYIRKYDSEKPWIFSGVVRTVPQVRLFDELLLKFNRKLDLVIYFELSDEDAIERMSLRRHCPKCGREYHLKYDKPKHDELCDDDDTSLVTREDDSPDAIHSRLEFFREKVVPVIETYKKRGIVMQVDAAPSIQEIHRIVVKRIENGSR